MSKIKKYTIDQEIPNTCKKCEEMRKNNPDVENKNWKIACIDCVIKYANKF